MIKKIVSLGMFISLVILAASCSSSKSGTALKANNGNLSGTWTITNILTNLPPNISITDVFDEAPFDAFKGSTWELVRNGKGSFTLTNGTKQDIYWSIYGKDPNAEFQFKKLKGEKARNVDAGYRLQLQSISANEFVARSPIDIGEGKTGYITYTFTKK
ncbi:MAG: hypothetical protein ABIP35_06070 [Ginsengibacter sp.]